MKDRCKTSDIFVFTAGPRPACHLSFRKSSTTTVLRQSRLKRCRSLEDVDGDGSGVARNKKRRLRLFLITSRLSRPFSVPSSHIVDRGSCKIAVWAKQKALGRNLLRKAAILNNMEAARQAFMYVEDILPGRPSMKGADGFRSKAQSSNAQIPRRQHLPLPVSPLGLSNYDALDQEDDDFQDDAFDDGNEGGGGGGIYSDFNILDPAEPVVEDHDSLDEFNLCASKYRPSAGLDGIILDISKEKERQKAVSFVQLYAT